MATHHHPLLTKKLPPPPTTLNSSPPLYFPSLRLVSPTSSHRRCLSTTAALVSSSDRDDNGTVNQDSKKVLLKGMRYAELEKWVLSHGFRPGQALMLWKRLYGNDIWAHCIDELEGLNKDFKKMLSEHAEFRALFMKDILTASDGTRKDFADFIHFGGWTGNRNSSNTLQEGPDYCLCFKSSGLCHELSVLLHRQDGFKKKFDCG